MNLDVWLTYLATVLVFMIAPGPSHLLMLSNSMTHGFKPSLATAAGDLMANVLQMIAAGLGLAAILVSSQNALTLVKWLGVAYLVWMGAGMWRDAAKTSTKIGVSRSASLKKLWAQGFLTSAANPKAVVFFAALFPQFIDPAQPFLSQFLALSLTYVAIDGLFLASYGYSASWIASKLTEHTTSIVHRIGAGLLLGAAAMLGTKSLHEN